MKSDDESRARGSTVSETATPPSDPRGELDLAAERPPARPTAPPDGPGGGEGARARHSRLRGALVAALGLALLGTGSVIGVFHYYGRDLPGFERLTDYDPPQVTKVFDQSGEEIAEFFSERRTVVPLAEIPRVMRDAMVAAEDGNFYAHDGLDYLGILRALIVDLKELRLAQGASTITQQVIKNMVLSPERSFARKIKEAILARRLEQNLSKDELLALYLNHVYFGHGRYGVAEAARFYFDKAPRDLTLGEAAMLAGLPQSPNRLSPLRNPERAKKRQRYVLDQMAQNGFIAREAAEAEMARPIAAVGREVAPVGGYYVEAIRRTLLSRYGRQALYEGGLTVEVAMDARLQRLSEQAVSRGLEALQRRGGLGKPQAVLGAKVWSELGAAFRASLEKRPVRLQPVGEPVSLGEAAPPPAAGGGGEGDGGEGSEEDGADEVAPPPVGWDFAGLDLALIGALAGKPGTDAGEEPLPDPREVAAKLPRVPLVEGQTLLAPLKFMDARALHIDLGGALGRIDRTALGWAGLKKGAALAEGALYRVRVLAAHPRLPRKAAPLSEDEQREVPLDLVPLPSMQAALVAIDPRTRRVVALDGGYDFAASQFNRATQARRQPGSSFKPIVYGAALESGRFTLASILNDAPDLYRDPWTGKQWRPQNYERDVYEGPMGLREALSKSKNTVSVRLIEAVGPEAVIDFARRVGIASPLPANLTLGLGTGEVTPLELANAYATFAAGGKSAEPALLLSVRDRHGATLEQANAAAAEEVVSPGVAFLVTSLMQSVVEEGTGRRARELSRPVAGKTGTASENRDAWFVGFTPELVAAVWVGRDNHAPLGRGGTGGGVALPIWLDFMKGALDGVAPSEFVQPEEIEAVRIDPKSGRRIALPAPEAPTSTSTAVALPGRVEFFVSGTAPEELATPEGEADPRFFLMEE